MSIQLLGLFKHSINPMYLLAHPQLLVRSVVVLTIIPNVRHLDIV
jgi:structural maintenance of chromosome 3 (chondroitin sulfate proteoglycan 6)